MKHLNQAIHIVLGADDNYAMPLAVTICSILKNVNKNEVIHFTILDGGIEDESKKRITNVFTNHKYKAKHIIEWIKPDLSYINNLPTHRLPTAAYLPLLIPDLLSSDCKKAIYLDCDLILETDITELWKVNVENTIICAARDLLIQTLSNPNGIKKYLELGGTANAPYFNSGVILMNLNVWRQEEITQKAIDYLLKTGESIAHHDQEALNAVLIGKWKELDPRWNQQGCIYWPQVLPESPFTKTILNMYNDLVNNPFIIHYLSSSKPWNFRCMHPSAHKFLYYLKESHWFTQLEWKMWWYEHYYKRFRWLLNDLFKTLRLIKIKNGPAKKEKPEFNFEQA